MIATRTQAGRAAAGLRAGSGAAGARELRRLGALRSSVTGAQRRPPSCGKATRSCSAPARPVIPPGPWAPRAERSYRAALRNDPRNVQATVGLGILALSAHDFAGGLRYGQRARRLAPGLIQPYSVVVDGLVELGRYPEAERALQRMVDLKPTLASYARVSYYRELRGDLAGAARAMSLAVAAGGGAPENVAYVQTLLGDLELQRGRIDAAELAYRLALARLPGYVDARFGLGRVQAARGELPAALLTLRRLVRDRPGCRSPGRPGRGRAAERARGAARRHLVARTRDRAGGAAHRARTPTPDSCCSRPTTATRLARCATAARCGLRRRASARPTPSAGP